MAPVAVVASYAGRQQTSAIRQYHSPKSPPAFPRIAAKEGGYSGIRLCRVLIQLKSINYINHGMEISMLYSTE